MTPPPPPPADATPQTAFGVGLATLAADGFVSVRFTYHQIVRRAAEQARRIRAIVRQWAPALELGA